MGAYLSYRADFGEISILSYYGQMPLAYNVFGNPIFYRCVSEVLKKKKILKIERKHL
jgi:hypothetical protein